MPSRPVAGLALLSLIASCTGVPVEEGTRRNEALARLCIATVADSLKVDRSTLTATAVQSIPEGAQVTIAMPDGSVHCYTNLADEVFAIHHIAPSVVPADQAT